MFNCFRSWRLTMVNLVLHCGARHVERGAVEEAQTPAASETWVPIAHHRLLELVELTLTRRHTRFIERDLPRIVHTAVGRLADMRGQQDERIRTYKERELADPAAHDLVIRAVDANVLPVTQLPAVLEEWRTPSHEEFA